MAELTVRLGEIAHARSGDKGSSATLGIFAYTAAGYEYLAEHLTAAVLSTYFQPMGCDGVDRYEVPNLHAINFVLRNVLLEGGSRSLRIDAQGKALGQIALEMTLQIPSDILAESVPAKGGE
jgi:hypothetical protein